MGTTLISLDEACEYDIVWAYTVGKVRAETVLVEDYDSDYPTWGEVLKALGFSMDKDDFFFVHAEKPTSGVILNYGNHIEDRAEKKLRLVGETIGYA